MASILIFGASGFIGRAVHAALAAAGTVVAPDRRACDLVTVDSSQLAALLERERPDAVVNCAGRIVGSGPDFTLAHPMVTAKLLDALAVASPRTRLVRIGSAAEYGAVAHGHRVREDEPTSPVSEYGISQLAATALMEQAAERDGIDAVVLRVFNPVGPGQPEGNLLGRAAALIRDATARRDDQVRLSLDDTHRDFVDVRDVARAVLAVLRVARLPERVYNVGSGQAVAVADAVHLLARQAGYGGRFVAGTRPSGANRSPAVPWMCADHARATRDLGWKPEHTLTDSLAALWTAAAEARRRASGPAVRRDVPV